VVIVVFQITFRAEMHANDVFLYQHIKTIQNIQIILNFSKKKQKILNFLGMRFAPRSQMHSLISSKLNNQHIH
jgi:hypothetical protein